MTMTDQYSTRYARSVASVATDVSVALRAAGAWCSAVTMDLDTESGAVVLDWNTDDEQGVVYGHTVRADTAKAGRWFLRRVLALHAPVHGWQIDREPDPYEWVNPIRVRRL